MLSGHCKRIYFSYSFPKNKAYRVKHIIQNKNFANGQYFTFCGMYHKVRLFKQFLDLSSKLFVTGRQKLALHFSQGYILEPHASL